MMGSSDIDLSNLVWIGYFQNPNERVKCFDVERNTTVYDVVSSYGQSKANYTITNDGTYYSMGASTVYKITITGVATTITLTGANAANCAGIYERNGIFYTFHTTSRTFCTINMSTGLVTSVLSITEASGSITAGIRVNDKVIVQTSDGSTLRIKYVNLTDLTLTTIRSLGFTLIFGNEQNADDDNYLANVSDNVIRYSASNTNDNSVLANYSNTYSPKFDCYDKTNVYAFHVVNQVTPYIRKLDVNGNILQSDVVDLGGNQSYAIAFADVKDYVLYAVYHTSLQWTYIMPFNKITRTVSNIFSVSSGSTFIARHTKY